jgi:prolyl-tRNA synthetase
MCQTYSYVLFGKMQRILDDKFKETGHSNAYFPLLFPKFEAEEKKNAEGLQKMCYCYAALGQKMNKPSMVDQMQN